MTRYPVMVCALLLSACASKPYHTQYYGQWVPPQQPRPLYTPQPVYVPTPQPSYSPAPIINPTPTPRRQTPPDPLSAQLDEFVAVDSRSWVMNSYVIGSMRNATVQSEGTNGVRLVYGEYLYNGNSRGWVKVRMVGNQLQCVEFWDFAGQCRPLGRSPSQMIAAGALVVTVAAIASSGGGGSTRGSAGNSRTDGSAASSRIDDGYDRRPEPAPRPTPERVEAPVESPFPLYRVGPSY
jgi:hypothetical protein